MAPQESCERDHHALSEKTLGLKKDVEAIQRVLEGMTNVLRDNLITLAGHDRASMDMRAYLMSATKDLQERMEHLDTLVTDWRSSQDPEPFEELLGRVRRMESELMQMYGLEPGRGPNPLAQHIAEALRLLREQSNKNPETGLPLAGIDFWQKKLEHVLQTAIAIAIVAAGWSLLKPFLATAMVGR